MPPTRNTPLDRGTVIRIAGDLIDTEGLGALTMKRLAAVAGVTQPALYRHVTGMDDVWRELGLRTRLDLAAAMSDACVGLSGPDAVRSVASAWRHYGQAHPGRYRSTDRYPVAGDDELEAAVERSIGVLALSMRAYRLDADELGHEARLVRSALHGFVSFELGEGHPSSPPLDATFDRLVDRLCSGIEVAANA